MGRRMAIAAGAAALALGGCGGSSGGGTPPITDRGATIVVPASDVARAELLEIQGNTGANALYVQEGALKLLLPETAESGVFTRVFRSRDGSIVARLTTPAGLSDLGFLRLEYSRGGETFVSQSVFGRATSLPQMPVTGDATYRGSDFAQLRLETGAGGADLSGDAIITADFGAGRVQAVLDFRDDASAFGEPIDLVDISGMVIAGNQFSGGTLTSRKGTLDVPEFSNPTTLDSSGLFGGPGAAEAGGVFLARFPGDRLLTGRYLAPRE
jgi:hypothetical protein